MNTSGLWQSLRAKLAPPSATRWVRLQHVGLAEAHLRLLQELLDDVGEQLDVALEVRSDDGQIVLMEAELAARLSPQLLHAYTDDRPLVTVPRLPGAGQPVPGDTELLAHCRRELLRQLGRLTLVLDGAARARAANDSRNGHYLNTVPQPLSRTESAFDSDFDSRVDSEQLLAEEIERDQLQVLRAVLHGMDNPAAPALCASYGPEASMRFDFRARLVTIDPLALQHLRVRRELPQPAPGARPQTDYSLRDLDQTVWDLGLASGPFVLLDQPLDWWHRPLHRVLPARVERYSQVPKHLDMGRLLLAGPQTPSALRRQARVSVDDVRRFVQACLLLRLVQWASDGSPFADNFEVTKK